MPRLRINTIYEDLLSKAPAAPAMQNQLAQAHGLIRSVSQRFVTVLRVAQAIVDRQHEFFEHGIQAMRPLRSEEHTSEYQSLIRTSYADLPLKKKSKTLEQITS